MRKKKWKKYRNLIAGGIMLLILVVAAVGAEVIAPYSYEDADMNARLIAPCAEHLFGTDNYGRDVFSRILYGSRDALKIALLSISIQLVIGITVGLIAGYWGGVVDSILSFIMDVTWSIPGLIAAFAIVTVLGKSLMNAIIAIALVSWVQFARIVRTKTMAVKNMPFLETGIAFGESTLALMFRYILPNIVPSLVVVASMAIPGAIMSTTSLSFLGLGAQTPSPDWGLALSESMSKITTAPWLGLFPGIALVFTTLGFTFLGEGLRDLLDPRNNSL